ncbi:MAG: DUF1565 domain-containing protein [Candidatus Latescibacteria bacterium]|nr:DUF1565 domain-containing protein [bacterium]MBD3424585.1 DUF1565 domain-containing protein [Candidatus Latescibacterota bacterium]
MNLCLKRGKFKPGAIMIRKIRYFDMKYLFPAVMALITFALCLGGCSDDSPSGPDESDGVKVSISAGSVSLGITESYQFSAVVTGGTSNTVEWYVDSISGGSPELGTITQGNPATYTAPDTLPYPASVQVMAVSQADSTRSDMCTVNLTFHTIYVNSSVGDDSVGVGGKNKPFRTITRGLQAASAGMKVLAAPGVYSDALDEDFTIEIPDSVTLEGEDWETSIIRMDAESVDKRTAVRLNCTDCAFRKFTLEEPDGGAPYWSIAVEVSTSTRARVDSIRCLERAAYSVIRVQFDTESIVENCYLVVSDGNYFERGVEVIFNQDGNGTILRGNTISGFISGIFFNYMQNTLVENNTLSGNNDAAKLCCLNDENSQPNPDFGGGARGSLGGNDFSDCFTCLQNSTENIIYAKFNIWKNDPPVEGDDFHNPDSLDGGAVIYE